MHPLAGVTLTGPAAAGDRRWAGHLPVTRGRDGLSGRMRRRGMHYVPLVNGALGGRTMAWQNVGNFRAFRTTAYGGGTEGAIHYRRRQG
jgi:hypothetical protein